jgi:ferredoxin-type protein NapH
VRILSEKNRNRRKTLRYFRWSVKAAFLLLFTLPITYFVIAPPLPVYSLAYGGLNQPPLLTLPYSESVCSLLLVSYDYVGPGAWLICPVGGLQALLTGNVYGPLLILTLVALFLFLIPIFLLGNVFCGWVCPLGTIIDVFDKTVQRFMPKTNMKREKRTERNREKRKTQNVFICPTCPFGRFLVNKNTAIANGVLVSALVGSAVFRFPVFCSICPIGISTRGMFHLKSLTSITGKMMPILVELWAIPVIAVLASLREKRYWCRKICPVGATLNLAGSVSPLFKPTVKTEKCVMKGCPETCEDYHMDYCAVCRQIDKKRCEKVCPQDINLLDKGSLANCTKCLECWIECEYNAVEIKLFGMPDAVLAVRRLKNKLKQSKKHKR